MSRKEEYYVIRIVDSENKKTEYIKTYRTDIVENTTPLPESDSFTVFVNMNLHFTTKDSWKDAKIWKTKKGVDSAFLEIVLHFYITPNKKVSIEDITKKVVRSKKLEKLNYNDNE